MLKARWKVHPEPQHGCCGQSSPVCWWCKKTTAARQNQQRGWKGKLTERKISGSYPVRRHRRASPTGLNSGCGRGTVMKHRGSPRCSLFPLWPFWSDGAERERQAAHPGEHPVSRSRGVCVNKQQTLKGDCSTQQHILHVYASSQSPINTD